VAPAAFGCRGNRRKNLHYYVCEARRRPRRSSARTTHVPCT
jgi:hypothetical protein